MYISKDTLDFGTITEGDTLSHIFTIKNTGGSILRITKVTSGCDCTITDLSKKELSPGDKAILRIQFNSRDYTGRIEKFVFIYSNDPKQPYKAIEIMGTVLEKKSNIKN